MNKSRHVTFRCTEEQYKSIKASAELSERSVSAYIVHTVLSKYYEQCCEELEEKVKWIWQHSDLKVLPLSGHGIKGDQLITHINTGEFDFELLSLPKISKDKP